MPTQIIENLSWVNAASCASVAGCHSNAWTSKITDGYELTRAPEGFSDLLTTLVGIFKPIDLPCDLAEQECGIVLHEYEYRMAADTDAKALSTTIPGVCVIQSPAKAVYCR